MNLLENIKVALSAIRSNLLRSVLTLLIIAFGIMALVGILTAIDAIKGSLTENLASMGTNTFNVNRKGTGLSGGRRGQKVKPGASITYNQAIRFKEQYDFPALVSVSVLGTTTAEVQHRKIKSNPNVIIYGIDENYLQVAGYALESGRSVNTAEALSGRKVAVIGSEMAELLFAGSTPSQILGATVNIRNMAYTVIGVLKSKGSSMTFSGDRMVMVPLMAVRQYFGSMINSYNLSVTAKNTTDLTAAMAEAEGVFRPIRRIKAGNESDFELEKSDGLINLIVDNTATIQIAAIFIGLVTLLGAAIGLMNIMLVSVTERTREIGICKSLGATRSNILIQFLVEAIVICQFGGLVGVLFGILAGNGVILLIGGTFVVPWAWVILGFSMCFIVGLLSGLYPAFKAARLDPIEALRYE